MIQSRKPGGTVAAALVLMLTVLMTGGCFFEDALSVLVSRDETGEADVIFISVGDVSIDICSRLEEEPSLTFQCSFGIDPEQPFFSRILTLGELLFNLLILDPMVVQLPTEATGFEGSFLHQDSGTGGDLSIISGLASVPVDDTRTLVAEPGNQLVVIDLPPGAPTSGTFSFNLRFAVPAGMTAVVTKPLFTGRVELADGSVFQAPLFPCVSDMAQVPELVIPIPVPGDVLNIPPPNPALACDGEIYRYAGGIPPVPTIGRGGLLALLSALAGLGWLGLRHQTINREVER